MHMPVHNMHIATVTKVIAVEGCASVGYGIIGTFSACAIGRYNALPNSTNCSRCSNGTVAGERELRECEAAGNQRQAACAVGQLSQSVTCSRTRTRRVLDL